MDKVWTPLPGFVDAATLTPEAMLALFPAFGRVWGEIEMKVAEKLFQSPQGIPVESNSNLEDVQHAS